MTCASGAFTVLDTATICPARTCTSPMGISPVRGLIVMTYAPRIRISLRGGSTPPIMRTLARALATRLSRVNSNELNAHSAHPEHDHRRNNPGNDRASDHEAVCEHPANPVPHEDHTRPGGQMREHEEYAQPIVWHEANVPGIVDEAGR